MLKVEIENLKYEVQHTLYFETPEEVSKYIKKCYPYEKRDFDFEGDFVSSSFTIMDSGSSVCGISVYRIKLNSESPVDAKKAWGGPAINIAEIFNVPFAYELEEEFYKWLSKIAEVNKDSYRIGLLDCGQSMKDYNELVTCCGSKDETVEFKGTKFSFGCNFGH